MNEQAIREVEIKEIDLRYEQFRLRNKTEERILLNSIVERGIQEALACVTGGERDLVLLDGFKRYRSAIKLKIHIVPVILMGSDEIAALLQLIRQSNARSLNILEQAALVDQLNRVHGMGLKEMARHLERSVAWVSVRLGIINEMPPVVKEAVFSGRFPVRNYMYNLRKFTRVNRVSQSEIESFVTAVAGKGLSTRDIDLLTYGYFHGGQKFKEQIKQGDLSWTLEELRRDQWGSGDGTLSEKEQRVIKDLELVQKYISRVQWGLQYQGLKAESFFATADLLIEGILNKVIPFKRDLERFYDQRRKTTGNKELV